MQLGLSIDRVGPEGMIKLFEQSLDSMSLTSICTNASPSAHDKLLHDKLSRGEKIKLGSQMDWGMNEYVINMMVLIKSGLLS